MVPFALPDVESHVRTFERILSNNLALRGERVLIVGDTGVDGAMASPLITRLFASASRRLGLPHEVLQQGVRAMGERSDRAFDERLARLPRGSVILVNLTGKIGRLRSAGLSFRAFCARRGHRFLSSSNLASLPNRAVAYYLQALDTDYVWMAHEGERLCRRLRDARIVRVLTKRGTDLRIDITGMKPILANAIYRTPGTGGNLPGSEVYIPPRRHFVEGRVVVDASMRTREATHLLDEPITLHIKEGNVVSITGRSAGLLDQSLRWAHTNSRYPWGVRRLCELGIGLNPRARVVGCTVLDEKALGTAHVAIGSNKWFGGSVSAIIHLDQVFRDPTLIIDGEEYVLPRAP